MRQDMGAQEMGKYIEWSSQLIDKGVTKIWVQYSGSGDSGQIDEIYFLKKGQINPNDGANEVTSTNCELRFPFIKSELFDLITNRCEEILNKIEDWWNNDGGYGTLIIDVSTGKYTIDNSIYYTNTTEYEHKGQITDTEE